MASAATPSTAKRSAPQAKTSSDYLQQALRDLDRARERASGEAREAIDAATDRIREFVKDASDRAQDEVGDWRESLTRAGADLRCELGVLAVRAQDSPEALATIASEVRKRKAQITTS